MSTDWREPFEVMADTGVMATASGNLDEVTDRLDEYDMTNGEQIFLARHVLLNALRLADAADQPRIIEAFTKACLDAGTQTLGD